MLSPITQEAKVAPELETEPARLLFLTSSSYSGSTLLTFLLNSHPHITTIGPLEGWQYRVDEPFYCSCGARLPDCPLFQFIAAHFYDAGVQFDFRNFETAFRLVDNPRLNRYLVGRLPFVHSLWLEKIRDALLQKIPRVANSLSRQAQSNLLMIQEALNYAGARVFVDATKKSYRMRHLARISQIELYVLYLVRDIRGVVASNMRKRGVSARAAARQWMQEQVNLMQLASEQPRVLVLHYEDLCTAPNEALERIQRFVGVEPRGCPVNYRNAEHHILGNVMRLAGDGLIRADERWKRELSGRDLKTIEGIVRVYADRKAGTSIRQIIERYAF